MSRSRDPISAVRPIKRDRASRHDVYGKIGRIPPQKKKLQDRVGLKATTGAGFRGVRRAPGRPPGGHSFLRPPKSRPSYRGEPVEVQCPLAVRARSGEEIALERDLSHPRLRRGWGPLEARRAKWGLKPHERGATKRSSARSRRPAHPT